MPGDRDVNRNLNEYFLLVFTSEKEVEAGRLKEGCSDILKHNCIRKKEMLETLEHSIMDKSSGSNGIYPRKLLEEREDIAEVLTDMFASLSATSVVLKTGVATVASLFKKGGRDKCGSYRLEPLTSVVGRFLEMILRVRTNDQFGKQEPIRSSALMYRKFNMVLCMGDHISQNCFGI